MLACLPTNLPLIVRIFIPDVEAHHPQLTFIGFLKPVFVLLRNANLFISIPKPVDFALFVVWLSVLEGGLKVLVLNPVLDWNQDSFDPITTICAFHP